MFLLDVGQVTLTPQHQAMADGQGHGSAKRLPQLEVLQLLQLTLNLCQQRLHLVGGIVEACRIMSRCRLASEVELRCRAISQTWSVLATSCERW